MQILNIFHVLIAIAMIAFILVQKGAGATAGAAFGSGASGTVFGARGAGNFLSRSTWVLAAFFCLISLGMAVYVSRTSLAPETDLGVVAKQSATEEESDAVKSPPATDIPVPTSTAKPSDLPVIESSTTAPSVAEPGSDLPAIEPVAEPVEKDGTTPDGDGS